MAPLPAAIGRFGARKILCALLGVALLPLMAVSLLSFLGAFSLWLDLFSHFRLQYALIFAVCSPVFYVLRSHLLAIVSFASALLNLACVGLLWLPNAGAAGIENSQHHCKLSIMNLNLQYGNRQYDAVDAVIRRFDPDVITLQELSPAMFEHFQKVFTDYQYSLATPRNDPYGIGILSKKRFVASDVNPLKLPVNLVMQADVDADGLPITVMATHVCGPTSSVGYDLDMELVHALKAFCLQRPNQALVLIGDCNSTPWSYLFQSILKAGPFLDSERGFGLQCSWPVGIWWLNIPIDHCFYSQDLFCCQRLLAPSVGSDHRPLFVQVGSAQK